MYNACLELGMAPIQSVENADPGLFFSSSSILAFNVKSLCKAKYAYELKKATLHDTIILLMACRDTTVGRSPGLPKSSRRRESSVLSRSSPACIVCYQTRHGPGSVQSACYNTLRRENCQLFSQN